MFYKYRKKTITIRKTEDTESKEERLIEFGGCSQSPTIDSKLSIWDKLQRLRIGLSVTLVILKMVSQFGAFYMFPKEVKEAAIDPKPTIEVSINLTKDLK